MDGKEDGQLFDLDHWNVTSGKRHFEAARQAQDKFKKKNMHLEAWIFHLYGPTRRDQISFGRAGTCGLYA